MQVPEPRNPRTPRRPRPQISVITVTHQRRELLLRKLAALEAQTLAAERFEWIVVVNASRDGSAAVLRAATPPFTLRLIERVQPLPVGVARNLAVQAAAAPLLHLSDDDCLPTPTALAAHVAAQGTPAAVIGAIEFVTAGASELFAPRRVGFWHLNGANATLPANAFRAVGGFEPTLEGYGGEDLLLGYRLHRTGLPFVARPDIAVRHLGPNPLRGHDLAKAHSAGRNAVRIARLHPELAPRLGVHPWQLALKRALMWLPLSGRAGYERAYLLGALGELAPAVPSVPKAPRPGDRER